MSLTAFNRARREAEERVRAEAAKPLEEASKKQRTRRTKKTEAGEVAHEE